MNCVDKYGIALDAHNMRARIHGIEQTETKLFGESIYKLQHLKYPNGLHAIYFCLILLHTSNIHTTFYFAFYLLFSAFYGLEGVVEGVQSCEWLYDVCFQLKPIIASVVFFCQSFFVVILFFMTFFWYF